MRSVTAKILATLAVFYFPGAAYAYIDPGSGMLVWQGLLAVIGALIAFVRNPVDKVRALLKRVFRK